MTKTRHSRVPKFRAELANTTRVTKPFVDFLADSSNFGTIAEFAGHPRRQAKHRVFAVAVQQRRRHSRAIRDK